MNFNSKAMALQFLIAKPSSPADDSAGPASREQEHPPFEGSAACAQRGLGESIDAGTFFFNHTLQPIIFSEI